MAFFFPKSFPAIFAVLRLRPGESFPEHHHEESTEIYYIYAGKGTMKVDSKPHRIFPGVAILIERGERHTTKNTGSVDLWFVAVRIPNSPRDSHLDGHSNSEGWFAQVEALLDASER